MIDHRDLRTTAAGMSQGVGAGGVRARILAAAGALLEEGRIEDASLRCIAARANIGLASIYSHFDSKEALFLRLALRGFSELTADLTRAREQSETGLGPMRRTARAYLSFAADRAPLFALMFDPGMMSRHGELREAEQAAFTVYLASVSEDERLPRETRADCALAVWTLGRGMTAMRASYPDGRPPDDITASLSRGIAWMLDR